MEKGSKLFGRLNPDKIKTLQIRVSETIKVSDVFGVVRKFIKETACQFAKQVDEIGAIIATHLQIIFSNLNNHSSPPEERERLVAHYDMGLGGNRIALSLIF